MPTALEFKNAIFQGLMNACDDAFHLTGSPVKITPEYVVTVNVAKSLFNIDYSGYGNNFKVKIEEKTSVFATECVHHNANLFFKITNIVNTDRNGKIDIAIYSENGEPICPIEVKDFAPQKSEIISDLIRNINILKLTDGSDQVSKVNFTFLALLEEHKNCVTKGNREFGLRSIEKEYYKKIAGLVKDYSDIRLIVEARTVAEDLIADDMNSSDWESDYDFAEMIADKYHYVGIVITAERAN